MTLTRGERLGRYEIVAPLGKGGMGEVYRAKDMQLGREVAVKVLSTHLAEDPQALKRFDREARAVAALSHPNILEIHDSGTDQGVAYAVMELLEGETLRDRVKDSAIPLRRALEITAAVADGLAAAHTKGVIHRDLKPENIFLLKDGRVKILDFGLARWIPVLPEEELRLLLTKSQASELGAVSGTVPYMSPEQVRGESLDARSDIFSLGGILYEMLIGKRLFSGSSAAETTAAILRDDPPKLAGIPPELDRIVRHCLEKEPERRLHSAHDLAFALKDLLANPSNDELRRSDPSAIVQPLRKAKWAVTALLALIAIAAIYFLYRKDSPKIEASKIPFSKIKVSKLTSTGSAWLPVISPDGKYIAYLQLVNSKEVLYLKQLATNTDIQILALPPDTSFQGYRRFSRDGEYIYYSAWVANKNIFSLNKIPVLGGNPHKIFDNVVMLAPAISPDGKKLAFIRFTEDGNRLMVAQSDGSGERLIRIKKYPETYWDIEWSPDGKIIACIVDSVQKIVGIHLDDGSEHRLLNTKESSEWVGVEDLEWLPDGSGLILTKKTEGKTQIYYVSYPDGKLSSITNDLNDYSGVSLTRDAKFLVTTQTSSNTFTVSVASSAVPAALMEVTEGSDIDDGRYGLSWTPDGKIIFSSKESSGDHQIWSVHPDGTNRKRITTGKGDKYWPVASPDGNYIVYTSDKGIWRMDSDGGNHKLLSETKSAQFASISPDSRWIVCSTSGGNKNEILKIPIDGGEETILASHKVIYSAAISPDGNQIAYFYNDLWLDPDILVNIISSDGSAPLKRLRMDGGYRNDLRTNWTPDGRGIAYIKLKEEGRNIHMLPIDGSPARRLTNLKGYSITNFSWSFDGKQIAYSLGGSANNDIVLIENLP